MLPVLPIGATSSRPGGVAAFASSRSAVGPSSTSAGSHHGSHAHAPMPRALHRSRGGAGSHRIAARRAAARRVAAAAAMSKVAVTGATGFVGSELVKRLIASGAEVQVLTRDKNAARAKIGNFSRVKYFAKADWGDAIAGCDAVVNLAGEPISTRWSAEVKQEILDSRVNTTRYVAQLINACSEDKRPKVFVSSSAIGYYGTSESETFTEDSAPGRDFLATVCKDWEAAANAASCGRIVNLRTGLVLASSGGVLEKMGPIFQLFLGGPIGEGEQWMSWIHRDDLVAMIIDAIADDACVGPVNGTAPNPVTMNAFCDTLGRVLGRPNWLPVPELPLQLLLGEGAILVLEGQKVVPTKAPSSFQFSYPTLGKALEKCY